jgi:S-formylglutathione hydrolase FrmB
MLLAGLLFNFLFSINPKDTSFIKSYKGLPVPITIQYAQLPKYNLLVLPGYGFNDLQWCTNTSVCEKAKSQGFNLIFIDVQKSLYLKQFYTQTNSIVKKYPTRTWIVDSVVMQLFEKKLLTNKLKTFVLGLSTGARGAALLMLENPTLFSGAACLSGDYDPTLQKNDQLMINALGPFQNNKENWLGDNNITLRAKEFKHPIFIAHGMKDQVVPVLHSILLRDKLLKDNPTLRVNFDFPKNGQHNYLFWNSEVDKLLSFFSSIP